MRSSILFLTNAYPDFDNSYRGIFIQKMATLLQNEGYEISVVTPKVFRKSPHFEKRKGIKVYRFPFFSGNRLLIEYKKVPYLRMLLYYVTGFFLTLYAVIRNRCDLIHAHWAIPTGLIGVWVGMVLRKPLLVTIHGSDLRMALEKPGILRRLFKYVCRKANYLNCVSESQRKEIEQLGIPGSKVVVLPMSIDETFLMTGQNRKWERADKPFTILSNRNLLPIYNVSLLIRAIPMVLDQETKIKVLIAGDGSERKKLEEEVKKLNVGTAVQFLGQIPHEEMPTLLARADIYVSTSLHDGASVSLLEAIGAGTFPIVTDISANREWITDGENGYLVPVDEERILANRIIDAMKDRELLEKSRLKNLSIIRENAFWPMNLRRVKDIYASLIGSMN